jgi:hypothetical protein
MTAKTHYNIVLVKPPGYVHAEAFSEIAETLKGGLDDLGVPAEISVNEIKSHSQNVILGANLLRERDATQLPGDVILYNFEQLGTDSAWNTAAQRALFSRFRVWDYSPRNVAFLRNTLPEADTQLVPLGFAHQLARIGKPAEQDIDVLFYGSLNERRNRILNTLKAAGLNVVHLFGIYGAERDSYVARAKVLLNMHYYDAQIFEIARVSYLLTNRKAVVSEFNEGTEIEPALRTGMRLVSYEGLVQACIDLVRDDGSRTELEKAGYVAFSACPQSDYLKPVLTRGAS